MTALMYRIDESAAAMTASPASSEPIESSGSSAPESLREGVTFLPSGWLPSDQEFYWSEAWQANERRSLEELARGEGLDFDNAADLIRWLFD